MKIAILGAGAMGMLFGAYLSRENEVTLWEKDESRVEQIRRCGVRVREKDGGEDVFPVKAENIADCAGAEPAELVLVFVKAMFEAEALEGAKALIGPETYLMTLQNGEGHEEVLLRYAAPERVIIGATQDNSSVIENGLVNHGGAGRTFIGPVSGDAARLAPLAENFTRCGFDTETGGNVKRLIWDKLFLNASASALTALFLCPLGFIADNAAAWSLAEKLIAEAVAVANADGQQFDVQEVTAGIRGHLERSKGGYTSIYADLKAGRRTEVDTISGAVVKAAKRLGVPVPNMEFAVSAIHAMEARAAEEQQEEEQNV